MSIDTPVRVATASASVSRLPARGTRFAARPTTASWPTTGLDRAQTMQRLTSTPFVLDGAAGQKRREVGLGLLLDWLEDQPGRDWQQRWLASGSEVAGRRWRDVPAAWLHERGEHSKTGAQALCAALPVAVCADLVRPGPGWFVTAVMRGGSFVAAMAAARDPAGFTRLRQECERDRHVSAEVTTHVLHRGALILGAKGGLLADVTAGDVLQLLEIEADAHVSVMPHGPVFYRLLHQMGSWGPAHQRPCARPRPSASAAPKS